MSFMIAVGLVAAGTLAVGFPILWLFGKWQGSRRLVERSVSPPFAAALPVAGLLVASLGLSLMWPQVVVVAFVAGPAFLLAMAVAGHSQRSGRGPDLRLVERKLEDAVSRGPLIERRAG